MRKEARKYFKQGKFLEALVLYEEIIEKHLYNAQDLKKPSLVMASNMRILITVECNKFATIMVKNWIPLSSRTNYIVIRIRIFEAGNKVCRLSLVLFMKVY